MKQTISTLLILFFFTPVFAQKTEFKIAFNANLSAFNRDAVKESYSDAYTTSVNPHCYTHNPYGSSYRLGYGASAGASYIFKNNRLVGLDAGYEVFKSRVAVNETLEITDSVDIPHFGKGESILTTNIINLFPHAGYRFKGAAVNVDLLLGADVGFVLSSKAKGEVDASDGAKFYPSRNMKSINTDLRPRLQLAVDYKKLGIYAGYSLGLADYKKDQGQKKASLRIIRFGITYRYI